MTRQALTTLGISILLAGLVATGGCETGGQTGAVAGAGIGALAGQAIGNDTKATLLGTAIGSGIGYMIGNEQDKQHARQLSRPQHVTAPIHSEVGSLGGTRWRLVSLNPRDHVPPYTSKIVEFKPNGRVLTMTTKPDGFVEVSDESYRVVGSTLIVNKPGYLINARFGVSGNQLIVTAEDFSAVLERL